MEYKKSVLFHIILYALYWYRSHCCCHATMLRWAWKTKSRYERGETIRASLTVIFPVVEIRKETEIWTRWDWRPGAGSKCAARHGGRRRQIPSTQACICGAKWANFLRVQFRDGSYKCPIVYLGILPHILFLNKEYSFSIVEIKLYPCSSKLALVLLKSWPQVLKAHNANNMSRLSPRLNATIR